MRVEFIWDEDCPNVEKARANLERALAHAKGKVELREWRRDDPEAPMHVREFGSPTILVDGADVADEEPGAGNCCRIYRAGDGSVSGVPSVELIVARLKRASGSDA